MGNYIKMCDHPIIQDKWEPMVGDWYAGPARDKEYIFFGLFDTDFLWLPTIEQLIEMVIPENYNQIAKQHALSRFGTFAQSQWDRVGVFVPIKHTWLKFVMSELYQKKWWEGEWLTEEEIRKKCIKNICDRTDKLNW